MKEIKKIIRPLRVKIAVEKMISYFLTGLCAACVLSIIFLAISKFVYISNIIDIITSIFAAVLLLALVYGIIKIPSMLQTAEIGDDLGFKQRLVTSFEILGAGKDHMTEIEQLLIEDTISIAREKKLAKEYRIKISFKVVITAFILCFALVLTGFSPVADKEGFEKQKLFERQTNENVEQIKEMKEEIKEIFSEEDTENINEILNKLIKETGKAGNTEEMKKLLQKSQEELMKFAKDFDYKNLKEFENFLEGNTNLKEMAKSILKGNNQEITGAVSELKKLLKEIDKEDLEDISEFLKDGLTENYNNEELKKTITEALGNLSEADTSAALETLANLSDIASNSAAMQNAVNDINTKLSAMAEGEGKNADNSAGKSDGKASSGEGGNDQNDNQNPDAGQNGQDSLNAGNGDTGGEGRGTGHIENERVYSSAAQDYEDYEADIKGSQNEGGETQQAEKKSFGERGESVPYQEVYQQYKNEALKSLDDYDIPYGMQEIIIEYFSSLDQ